MSPSPYLTAAASATIREKKKNLPTPRNYWCKSPPPLQPPPAGFVRGCDCVLPVGADPGRRAERAGAQTDAAFGRAADSGKPSCVGELLVFCRRHDAPPEPLSTGTRLFLDIHTYWFPNVRYWLFPGSWIIPKKKATYQWMLLSSSSIKRNKYLHHINESTVFFLKLGFLTIAVFMYQFNIQLYSNWLLEYT